MPSVLQGSPSKALACARATFSRAENYGKIIAYGEYRASIMFIFINKRPFDGGVFGTGVWRCEARNTTVSTGSAHHVRFFPDLVSAQRSYEQLLKGRRPKEQQKQK